MTIQQEFLTEEGKVLWIDKEMAIEDFLESMGLRGVFETWYKGYVKATLFMHECHEDEEELQSEKINFCRKVLHG